MIIRERWSRILISGLWCYRDNRSSLSNLGPVFSRNINNDNNNDDNDNDIRLVHLAGRPNFAPAVVYSVTLFARVVDQAMKAAAAAQTRPDEKKKRRLTARPRVFSKTRIPGGCGERGKGRKYFD